MSFLREAGVATKTYPRKGMKFSTAWRAEFGLGNHLGPRHGKPAIPDLDVTDDIEVF
jgi:hypothetical protein